MTAETRAAVEKLEERRYLAAQLVKDINTQPTQAFGPQAVAVINNFAYFGESDGTHGDELFRTDGTAAGTVLVKDINSGPGDSFPGGFVLAGSEIYFSAFNASSGLELWKTDGTAAGTVQVADINPGTASSSPTDLTVSGSTVYFFADDGVHGRELWKSDGTAAGTVLVDDIDPGSAGQGFNANAPRMVATSDGRLNFIAYNGSANYLYTSTGAVGNLTPLGNSQLLTGTIDLVAGGNSVYFSDGYGYLWTSDGTSTGTKVIQAVNLNISRLTDTPNGEVYFSRGASVDAVVNGSVTPALGVPNAAILTTVGNTVYVSGTADGGGTPEVFSIDGNSSALAFSNLTAVAGGGVGSTLYLASGSATTGYSLYSYAGSGSPILVAPLSRGPGAVAPTAFVAVNNKLLLTNVDAISGTELWVSDGTANGTHLLDDINPGTSASYVAVFPQVLNNQLILSANDGVTGTELWISDGTSAGTIELKDINTGAGPSNPTNVCIDGHDALFTAYNPSDGIELWKTDGTTAGTILVADIDPGSDSSSPSGLTYFNGYVYFSATDGVHGSELWRSDGSADGTQMVDDINSGPTSSDPSDLRVSGKYLFFVADSTSDSPNLYRTDGTATGTIELTNGTSYTGPANLAAVDGKLYFSEDDGGELGSELWTSDGTVAGTTQVADLYPGMASSSPSDFTDYDGIVYFVATDSTGSQLWKTDGTAAETSRVTSLNSGGGGLSPRKLTVCDGKLYFVASDGVDSGELWSSTGTTSSTQLVNATVPVAVQGNLVVVENKIYFVASGIDGNGPELWSSDGTADATVRSDNLMPGPFEGVSGFLVVFDGDIYAYGSTELTGGELYRFFEPTSPSVDQATVDSGLNPTSVSFTFDENVADSVSASELQLTNTTTRQVVNASAKPTFDFTTNTATFTLPVAAMSSGVYQATLLAGSVTDNSGNAITTAPTVTFSFTAPLTAPSVSSMQLNGNVAALAGTQRSMIDSVQYSFNEPVDLAASNSFSIALHAGDNGTVPTLSWSALGADANGYSTTWVVSFSGSGVVGHSIADGVYDLDLSAGAATNIAGASNTAASTTTFARLFGDITGDGRVNLADFGQLGKSFGSSVGGSNYQAALDYNDDGMIGLADYGQFKLRYGKSFTS